MIASYLKDIFDCRIDALPVETMSHPFMGKYATTKNISVCLNERNITVNECDMRLLFYCLYTIN